MYMCSYVCTLLLTGHSRNLILTIVPVFSNDELLKDSRQHSRYDTKQVQRPALLLGLKPLDDFRLQCPLVHNYIGRCWKQELKHSRSVSDKFESRTLEIKRDGIGRC